MLQGYCLALLPACFGHHRQLPRVPRRFLFTRWHQVAASAAARPHCAANGLQRPFHLNSEHSGHIGRIQL